MSTALEASKFRRAKRIIQKSEKRSAKREFFHELTEALTTQLEFDAKLADNWNWPKGSIFALGRASSYDDLGIEISVEISQRNRGTTCSKR